MFAPKTTVNVDHEKGKRYHTHALTAHQGGGSSSVAGHYAVQGKAINRVDGHHAVSGRQPSYLVAPDLWPVLQ